MHAAKLIDDGVFDFQCTKVRVREVGPDRSEIDCQGLPSAEVIAPANGFGAAVKFFRRRRRKFLQRKKDSARYPRFQTGAISHRQRAAKRDPRAHNLDRLTTDLAKLFCEEFLQAFGRGREEIENFLIFYHAPDLPCFGLRVDPGCP